MISSERIGIIIDKIVTAYQPDKIMLFGSHATGQAIEDSDLDLLIVKDTKLPRH